MHENKKHHIHENGSFWKGRQRNGISKSEENNDDL